MWDAVDPCARKESATDLHSTHMYLHGRAIVGLPQAHRDERNPFLLQRNAARAEDGLFDFQHQLTFLEPQLGGFEKVGTAAAPSEVSDHHHALVEILGVSPGST